MGNELVELVNKLDQLASHIDELELEINVLKQSLKAVYEQNVKLVREKQQCVKITKDDL